LEIDEVKMYLEIHKKLPDEDKGEFTTLGGFILDRVGHIPHEGEIVVWDRYNFEIIDMDRQRIDKVLVTIGPAIPEPNEDEEEG